MKSSTLKLIAEIRSVFALCAQLGSRIPSLKKVTAPLQSFTEWISTLLPTTTEPQALLSESGLVSCVKEGVLAYSEIEQKIIYALIREKISLSVSYLRASRDKSLDFVFLLKIQEIVDQKD